MPSPRFSSEAEIHRIGAGLIDRSLPKHDWTHAAHFAAALWLMRYRPEIDAATHMPGLIRAYNEATGVANTDSGGYHETITLASLRAARAFMDERAPASPLHDLVNELMASDLGDSGWRLAYWSKSRLFSVEARRSWVEPDLRTLPF